MAKLDVRVRLLRRMVSATAIADLDERDIARLQRPLARNPLVNLMIGTAVSGVEIEDGTAAGESSPVLVRVYRPVTAGQETMPLIVNIHGGGMIVGSLEQCDWLCSTIAARVGAVVVSIGYRTAPAHRWPAAAEDCYAATVDIAARAEDLGGDPSRLSVMGDSAGGNLAAVVALMARDRSGPAIGHQVLLYPATDLTLSSPSLQENARAPVISKRDVVASRDHYLGGQDPRHPYASPLLADELAGLPPALIQVAEYDPIRDDGLRYAQALRAAGVQVRATNYVGMPHGFLAFPKFCRCAPQALAEICAVLTGAW
ncbi:MAG: putative lipase [Mycobacterium sp.]|nr:putative lipase [Mycobacterium sp.]